MKRFDEVLGWLIVSGCGEAFDVVSMLFDEAAVA